jgi:hypothetical protein
VVADGVGRDVDPGEIALALHAADDAQVFVLTGVGPVSDPTGQRLSAIDARDGTIRSLWAADRSAWLPLAFDVAEGRDRLLLTEYEYESGTDVIQFFARQARLLDPETGVLGDRVGGGGVPVVADRSLRRVLMSQARGPAGHVLASGDPAGTLAPIAHWKGSPDAFLRVSSSACGGACPLGECRAGAALHAAPSVTLDGAS